MTNRGLSVERRICKVEEGVVVYRFTDMKAAAVYARGTSDSALLAALRRPEMDNVVLCVNKGKEEAMGALIGGLGLRVRQLPPTNVCLRAGVIAEGSTSRRD